MVQRKSGKYQSFNVDAREATRYDVYNKMKDRPICSEHVQPSVARYRMLTCPPVKYHDFFTKTKDKQLYDGALSKRPSCTEPSRAHDLDVVAGWCWPGSSSYPDLCNPEARLAERCMGPVAISSDALDSSQGTSAVDDVLQDGLLPSQQALLFPNTLAFRWGCPKGLTFTHGTT